MWRSGLVVGVGLDDFDCAEKELPHLLEHLLFSGIDATGEGGLEERMQALGGDWNAFTSNADTTFVIEAPAKNQRKVLDLLLACSHKPASTTTPSTPPSAWSSVKTAATTRACNAFSIARILATPRAISSPSNWA
jgi:hypothetical protein